MYNKLVVLVCLVLVLTNGFVVIKCEDDYEVTDCDRDMAKIMCDELIGDVAACAELMPQDEQKYFFECASDLKISSEQNWNSFLANICSETDPAQIATDVIFCWNDKMNATVDKLGDDTVYPYEHFQCKKELFTKAVKKTSCLCQVKRGLICVDIPSGTWENVKSKFG